MRILVKLGGALLDTADLRTQIAQEIAGIASDGRYQMVVVHGGGKQMTRYLAERGVESRFINGLRVTTPDVIDAVVKVFAGSVNAQVVTALRAAGARPVGLSGLAAGLVDAEIVNPELGQVGRPVHCDAQLLSLLTGSRYLPVVACIAGDARGTIYNVNADQMAAACAVALSAEKLLFLTDVDGVRDASGRVRTSLTVSDAQALISEGAATGGMQAKLEAAISAIGGHAGEAIIAPGAHPGILREMLEGAARGTRLTP
jgi:acetylglutamate kinase